MSKVIQNDKICTIYRKEVFATPQKVLFRATGNDAVENDDGNVLVE